MIATSVSLFAALLLFAAAPPAIAGQPSSSAAQSISLPAFTAELDRLATAIAGARRAEDALTIARNSPPGWRVGDVDVSLSWLRAALDDASKNPESWASTREVIRGRLLAIRAEVVDAPGAGLDAARTRAHGTVATILARDEFKQSAASRWREDFQRRIGEWFESLFSRLGLDAIVGRSTTLVFAWAIGLVALGGLGIWIGGIVARQRRSATLKLGLGAAPRVLAREWALKALSEARAGKGREAVRCAYHAALARLEEQGVWRVDDARTPREYLRILKVSDARQPPMQELTRRFEQVWYGNRPVTPDDGPRLTAHLETLGCLRPGERAI